MVNSSNKVQRYSTKSKTPTSYLDMGDSLRYTYEVENEMVELVELVDINKNEPASKKYSTNIFCGNTKIATNIDSNYRVITLFTKNRVIYPFIWRIMHNSCCPRFLEKSLYTYA